MRYRPKNEQVWKFHKWQPTGFVVVLVWKRVLQLPNFSKNSLSSTDVAAASVDRTMRGHLRVHYGECIGDAVKSVLEWWPATFRRSRFAESLLNDDQFKRSYLDVAPKNMSVIQEK